MKKSQYYISVWNFDEMKVKYNLVNGYIDNEVGYEKTVDGWIATDLESGMKIIHGRTRKEAVAKVLELQERIEKKKKEPKILEYIAGLNEFKANLQREE